MWRQEVEEEWRRIRESYPDSVLFFRLDGLYFIRGEDVQTAAAEVGLKCAGESVGFDEDEARLYMRLLSKKGLRVADAVDGRVRLVEPKNGHSGHATRQTPKRRFIALDPAFFLGTDTRGWDSWLRQPRNAIRYSHFAQLVAADDWRTIHRERGELYVFEVDSWYEIDWYLTTFSRSDVELLARAAMETHRKLHCWLVKPKAWRERRRMPVGQKAEPPSIQRIEQLRLL